MVNSITRLGDMTEGHGQFESVPSIESSDNVFVNGIGVVREGDAFEKHCDDDNNCHTGVLETGSATVFVNGRGLGRVGDSLDCGDVIAEGSPNTFSG